MLALLTLFTIVTATTLADCPNWRDRATCGAVHIPCYWCSYNNKCYDACKVNRGVNCTDHPDNFGRHACRAQGIRLALWITIPIACYCALCIGACLAAGIHSCLRRAYPVPDYEAERQPIYTTKWI